jgi:hypothetical protein
MTKQRVDEIVKECRRQEESCKYTSAGLYIWQKRAQLWKSAFIVAPIILGGIASSQLVKDSGVDWANYAAAGLALLAGFFPAIFEALGMDMRVREIATAAGEFTNLRDRFRQLGSIGADMNFEELNPAFEQLMDRMDAARKVSPPLPEKFFEQGRKKIEAGDYDFAVDARKKK